MSGLKKLVPLLLLLFAVLFTQAKIHSQTFNVIAFYTAKNDQAHISFVHEANRWFSEISVKQQFRYVFTDDWSKLNSDTLSHYQVVIFLDTRPDVPAQRIAFQEYMEKGGAFMGFHFSAFALTPSAYPQNWDWFHNQFLGSGEYASNTWRPTSAILEVEDQKHPATKRLPNKFKSQPTNGIAGKTICEPIPKFRFWSPSILPASHWVLVRSRMKYGILVIILLYGPTQSIG